MRSESLPDSHFSDLVDLGLKNGDLARSVKTACFRPRYERDIILTHFERRLLADVITCDEAQLFADEISHLQAEEGTENHGFPLEMRGFVETCRRELAKWQDKHRRFTHGVSSKKTVFEVAFWARVTPIIERALQISEARKQDKSS